jgi:hypothetical protein
MATEILWLPFDSGGMLDGDQIFFITILHTHYLMVIDFF